MDSFRILRQSLLGHPAESWEIASAVCSAAVPSCCTAPNRWRHHKGTDRWESQRKSKEKPDKESDWENETKATYGSRGAKSLWCNMAEHCNTGIVSDHVPWDALLAQLSTVLQSVMSTVFRIFKIIVKKYDPPSKHEEVSTLYLLHLFLLLVRCGGNNSLI